MDVKKVFETVIAIDKKIYRTYEKMIVNDYLGKSNEEKINELKELIGLEVWAYKKLNLSYEELQKAIDELSNLSIGDLEQQINERILIKKIKLSKTDLLQYMVQDEDVEILAMCRIYDYLSKVYYLNEKTPRDVNCYIKHGQIIPKKDDETDIYITDTSYFKMQNLSVDEYIKKAVNEHNIVLTFDSNCKKRLEIEAQTDIEQMLIMLLEIKATNDVNNKYFYFDEIYKIMFVNSTLENRVIRADFLFDDLFGQFSIQSNLKNSNRKFLDVYRSQYSYLIIYEFINFLFSFNDSDFKDNNKYKLILFNVYFEKIKAFISVLKIEELEFVKNGCAIHYKDVIENNECAKMVNNCLQYKEYEKLNAFVNIGVEKVKQY